MSGGEVDDPGHARIHGFLGRGPGGGPPQPSLDDWLDNGPRATGNVVAPHGDRVGELDRGGLVR